MGRLEQLAKMTLADPAFPAERWSFGDRVETDDELDQVVTQPEPIRPKKLVARINKDIPFRHLYLDPTSDLRELCRHLSRTVNLNPEFGSHPWIKRFQPVQLDGPIDVVWFIPQLAKALPAIAEPLTVALKDAASISPEYRVALEALSQSIHGVGFIDQVSPHSPAIEGFVLRAQRLEEHGNPDEALDLIYDAIDALLRDGRFEKCDEDLRDIDVSTTSVDILLGVLTATLPAHSRLPSRPRLVRAARDVLLGMNEDADLILAGLEG